MQFSGAVKSFDADEGFGYIIRDRGRRQILVRSAGLALGVDSLEAAERVEFDIDGGTNPQACDVVRR